MNLDLVRVLLIDDDEDDFANIRGILSEIQKSKYDLSWASSYKEGLIALCEARYDACLLDFQLGEVKRESFGLKALRLAKKIF